MTPKEFLECVWPSDGLFCIAIPATKGYRHRVCGTIDEAAEYVEQVKDTHDVFFNIHTLIEPTVYNPQKKNADGTLGGYSVRLQTNMRESRAFFFDIDVGDAPKYTTRKEAAAAIFAFVEATGLPKPMLTSSGGGIHVYWFLEDTIPSKEWVTHAAHLKNLAVVHGLKIDPARTTDTSSVLRVVGTFNHKRGEKRPVELKQAGEFTPNAQFLSTLSAAMVGNNVAPKQLAAAGPMSPLHAQIAAAGGSTTLEFDGAPVTAKEVLQVCGQLRWMATEQDKVLQPEWYAGLGVMVHTSTPDAIHKFSNKYPGYDHGETEMKADQAKAFQPTSCEKIHSVSSRPQVCHACPLFNAADNSFRVKGPMPAARNRQNIAPPVVKELIGGVEVTYTIPPPPGAYKRGKDGGVNILIDKEGKEVLVSVYPYDFYPIWRATNAQTGTVQKWRHHPPFSAPEDIEINGSEWGSDNALRVKLATHSIYPENYDRVKAYMSAYIRHLMKSQPAVEQHNHLGWTDDRTEFVMPQHVIKADGTLGNATLGALAATTNDFIFKSGKLVDQVNALQFFNQAGYVPNQFFICSGLGAPLFASTGHHGVIVNAVGDPGASKSTALATVASFYGKPEKYVMSGTAEGATALFRSTRMDLLSNLPVCLDEITEMDPEKARSMAMSITQAGGRQGLKNDGTPRKAITNVRSTVLLTTSNKALQNVIAIDNSAGTAGAVRIVEIAFKKLGLHKPVEAEAFMRAIKQNFGHVGDAFLRHVVPRRPEIEARVLAELESLANQCNMRPDERFWFGQAAEAITAGMIAKELGLVPWDIAAMRKWWIEVQLPAMRATVSAEVERQSPVAILTDYIARITSDIVRTSAPAGGTFLNVTQKPRGELLGHYDLDKQTLWVLRTGFIEYCQRRSVFAADMLRQLQTMGIVPQTNSRILLGKGTDFERTRNYCFMVDMTHTEMAGSTVQPPPASPPQPTAPQPPANTVH